MQQIYIYSRGFFFGVFIGLILSILAICIVLFLIFDPLAPRISNSQGQRPKTTESGEEIDSVLTCDIQKDSWPAEIVKFLTNSLSPCDVDHKVKSVRKKAGVVVEEITCMTPTLDVDWINVIAARYFLALRSSQIYKERTCTKISHRMNSKLKNNSFLTHLQIIDLDLGDHVPRIMGVRLIKDMTDDLSVSAEIDIVYKGGASVAIEVTIVGNIKIPARIYINALAGKGRLRCPSTLWADMLGFHFVQDPGVTFTIDTPLSTKTNESIRNIVNGILASIARKAFIEMWVAPAWRTFFMPLMNPTLEEKLKRLEQTQTAIPSLRSTLATKAATLWESRAPLLKFKTFDDVDPFQDQDTLFPVDTSIHQRTDISEMNAMSEMLLSTFLETIKTVDSTVDSSLEESSENWKFFKQKNGLDIYKKIVSVMDKSNELTKSLFEINCDCHRVYSILSNPEHFRHITDQYQKSTKLFKFGQDTTCRQLHFQISKNSNASVTLLSVCRQTSELSYIVVSRSCIWINDESESIKNPMEEEGLRSRAKAKDFESLPVSRHHSPKQQKRTRIHSFNSFESNSSSINGIPDFDLGMQNSSIASTSNDGAKVYMYGFLIEGSAYDENYSKITCISSISPKLQKAMGDMLPAIKMKTFIEELVNLSSNLAEFEDDKKIDKLKSYIGATAAYVMKNVTKLKSSKTADELFNDESSDQLASELLESTSELQGTMNAIPFDGELYIERDIGIKEMTKIQVPFHASNALQVSELNWEFISKTESSIAFGIEFVPNESNSFELGHFYDLKNGAWIIFPLTSISAFSKPACGRHSLFDFPSGTFYIIFDNSNGKGMRSLSTRCWIHSTETTLLKTVDGLPRPICEFFADVFVSKKSNLTLTFVHSKCIESFLSSDVKIQMTWTLVTGGNDFMLYIFYEDDIQEESMKEEREKREEFNANIDELPEQLQESMDSLLNASTTSMDVLQDKSGTVIQRKSVNERLQALGQQHGVKSISKENEKSNETSSNGQKSSKANATAVFKMLGKAKEIYKETATQVASNAKNVISTKLAALNAKNRQSQQISMDTTLQGHPRAMLIIPPTRVNSRTEKPFFGSMDISKKYGAYTVIVDHSNAMMNQRNVVLSISFTCAG